MRTIVPTAVNEIIGLVKGTSVVYVLAYGELFYIVGVIYGRNQRVVPLLIVAGIWYLVADHRAHGRPVLRRAALRQGRRCASCRRRRCSRRAGAWASRWSRLTGAPLPSDLPPSYGRSARNRAGPHRSQRDGSV